MPSLTPDQRFLLYARAVRVRLAFETMREASIELLDRLVDAETDLAEAIAWCEQRARGRRHARERACIVSHQRSICALEVNRMAHRALDMTIRLGSIYGREIAAAREAEHEFLAVRNTQQVVW